MENYFIKTVIKISVMALEKFYIKRGIERTYQLQLSNKITNLVGLTIFYFNVFTDPTPARNI